MPDVLEDGTRRSLQLLSSGALLAQGIAELVILEDQAVGVEAPLLARLLPDAPGEGAWALGLHRAHNLELGSTPLALRPADDELLAPAAALASFTLPVHEEHEHTPLFLHGAQSSTASSRDVADAIAGHVHHSAIIAILPTIDIDRTLELLEQPFHVLASFLPLRTRAREDCRVADVLYYTLRRAFQLLACPSLLAQCIGELIVLEGHGVGPPCS
mmetsp:Transcript_8114/g.20131  ORF Transcript_8114/g.20131 Transcript_8114/m.20131 type:complete len:215 (+) Transcript_8114:604-1248(+)